MSDSDEDTISNSDDDKKKDYDFLKQEYEQLR
jgi:hypothetical protein